MARFTVLKLTSRSKTLLADRNNAAQYSWTSSYRSGLTYNTMWATGLSSKLKTANWDLNCFKKMNTALLPLNGRSKNSSLASKDL